MSRCMVVVDVDDETGEVTFERWRTRGGRIVERVITVTTLDDVVHREGGTRYVPPSPSPAEVLRWLGVSLLEAD